MTRQSYKDGTTAETLGDRSVTTRLTVCRYKDGTIAETSGDGPLYASSGRDTDGRLEWVEINTGEEALFRADKPVRETDLHIARQMVNAFNRRYAEVSEVAA